MFFYKMLFSVSFMESPFHMQSFYKSHWNLPALFYDNISLE